MRLESEESVFDVKINSEGARAIQSVTKMMTILFIIAILLYCFMIPSQILRFLYFQKLETSGDLRSIIELRILPIVGIIFLALNFYQLMVYIRFVNKCNQSIRDRDQDSFNHSFTIMRRSIIIFAWLICLQLITGGYSLYAALRDYLRVN